MRNNLNILIIIGIIFIIALVFILLARYHTPDYNCDDFRFQQDAVKVYQDNDNDIYELDTDGDHNPCEGLPTGK